MLARCTRLIIVCLALGLALAACRAEPERRKAFIDFLQTEVLEHGAFRLPRPTPEQEAAFGGYAEHYAIITRFHDRIDAAISDRMQMIVRGAAPRSIEDILARRNEFGMLRQSVKNVLLALEEAYDEAETARATLRQSEDLARIYIRVYDRLVSVPAQTVSDIFPVFDETFAAMEQLAVLLDENRDAIRVSGSLIETRDDALRERLQAALAAVNAQAGGIADAQRRMMAIAQGG